MLAGAFASGQGLGESKESKRAAAEIAEIKALAAPPKLLNAPSLLGALRGGDAPVVDVSASPINLKQHILQSQSIARQEVDRGNGLNGDAWVVLSKPSSEHEETCIVCLGQDGAGRLRGAIGWWPSGARTAKGPLQPGDATRSIAINDDSFSCIVLPHPTVTGVGENSTVPRLLLPHLLRALVPGDAVSPRDSARRAQTHNHLARTSTHMIAHTAPSTLRSFFIAWQAPMPATSNLNAPLPVQLAETVRQYQVARAQINARLQRGGASSEEKQHVRALLGEAYRGIEVPLAATSPSSPSGQSQPLWPSRPSGDSCLHPPP